MAIIEAWLQGFHRGGSLDGGENVLWRVRCTGMCLQVVGGAILIFRGYQRVSLMHIVWAITIVVAPPFLLLSLHGKGAICPPSFLIFFHLNSRGLLYVTLV